MPYPNEHAARVKEPGSCVDKSFKRMNQGKGVSLILCKNKDGKMEAQAYRFAKDKFTPEQAKAWLAKHDIKPIGFEEASGDNMNAKLSMKANISKPEIDGMIWSAGMHHVFVNDEPARVYVPEETIMNTFDSVRNLIKDQGRMPIGIDHLSDSIIEDNEILAKMNLLDVGSVNKVGTDGRSIYILESELSNQQIKDLHSLGELPAYSIVGAMDAKPCPSGMADYVVNEIDVERVDIVQEGGCQVCKVGAQPNELILTSKKSERENDIMVDETKEKAVEETKVDEVPAEPEVEEKKEDEVKEEEEEDVVAVEESAPAALDDLSELKKEIAELKQMLGGKKPKVEASKSETFDASGEVDKLIKAGRALPKMRGSLLEVAEASPEAFMKMAASMPKMVNMKTMAKLAKIEEQTKPEKKEEVPYYESEEYKEALKAFGMVDKE